VTGSGPLAAAASSAPAAPGVYFWLGGDRTLLYVGKAGDLRRRLAQHARAGEQAAVRQVRWEVLADEPAASAREADLIVALRPALNAAVVGDARWAWVVVTPAGGDRLTLAVTASPPGAGSAGRAYGCFPHLGVGVTTPAAIAGSEGYAAMVQLLWAAQPDGAEREGVPAPLAGPSPPASATLAVAPDHRRPLADLLGGTSDRLVAALVDAGAARRSPALGPSLRRDGDGARAFHAAGPRALRALRRRHGLPPGPVDRATFEAALAAEVRAAIGEFRLPDPDAAAVVGRRLARAFARQSARRRQV
jgi:hypothetical protein